MPKATKAAPEKKTTKAAAKKTGGKKKFGGLNVSEMKVLEALKDGEARTRNDLRGITGIQKGWSKILGAPTKGVSPESLEGRKFVKSEKHEAQGEGDTKTPAGLYYTIMAGGKKVLEKANKEMAKAEAEA